MNLPMLGMVQNVYKEKLMVTMFAVRNIQTQQDFDSQLAGKALSVLAIQLLTKRGICVA